MPEPALSITMSIKGMEELSKRFRDPQTVGRAARKGLSQMGQAVRREAVQRAPVGVSGGGGGLRGSIVVQVERGPIPLEARVGPTVAYGAPVEFGSRPHMPPVSALIDWVRLKAARGAPNPERIAWAIARTIARRGTRAQPYMRPGLRAARVRIRKIADKMALEIARAMGGVR